MAKENEGQGAKERNPHLPLEEILNRLMDSEGFVIFAASLTNRVDEKGLRVIDFNYLRDRLSFEDTRSAVVKFKEEFLADVEKGLDLGEI